MMRNRGTVAVLAMIFMAVFVVLGLSFFTMATTSSSTAKNERDSQAVAAATDSGVAMVQRQIGDIIVSQNSATGVKGLMKIGGQLRNLKLAMYEAGATVQVRPDKIKIPPFKPHGDTSVQCVEAEIGFPPGVVASAMFAPMRLTVTGYDGNPKDPATPKRVVTMDLVCRDRTADIFSYGVFAKGRVDLADGKASILGFPPDAGSLGSAYTGDVAIYVRGGKIDGEVAVSGDPAELFVTSTTSGSIGGVDITDPVSLAKAMEHVREMQPPTITPFTPNKYYRSDLTVVDEQSDVVSGKTVADVCFQPPAGQDKVTIKFSGGDVLEGLIYVKKGVTLDIAGGVVIKGTIVVEDPNLDGNYEPKVGSNETSTSSILFHGTPIFQPSDTWPSPSVVPSEDQKTLQEYSMMGPSAYVYIQGSSGGKVGDPAPDDKHAGFAKTVICGTLEENGSSIVNIRDGTLITMSDTMVTGTKGFSSYLDGDGVRITRTPGWKPPYGGYTHLYSWVVDPKTYQEGAK